MKDIQSRYQFIIGFVAIIISLSAFKDELSKIPIDLGFITFSASKYLLSLIISFVLVIHIYAVPYILSSTKFANYKFLNQLEYISYGCFILLLSSPSILAIIYVSKIVSSKILLLNENTIRATLSIISALTALIASSISKWLVTKFKQYTFKIEQAHFEIAEIKSLEIAKDLFNKKFYNQSYLESFKALENSIFKRLRQEELIFRQGNFIQMVEIARKYSLITNEEFSEIQQIRAKRNSISHSTAQEVTRGEAETVLQFTRALVGRIDKSSTTIPNQEEPLNSRDDLTSSYFKGLVFKNLQEAIIQAKNKNKPIFMIIYDLTSTQKSRIDYSLKYFTEYEITKSLLEKNFIQVLADKHSPGVEKYIPVDEPLENCLLVSMTPDEQIIESEGVYANPDEGLSRVKKLIERWNNSKCGQS